MPMTSPSRQGFVDTPELVDTVVDKLLDESPTGVLVGGTDVCVGVALGTCVGVTLGIGVAVGSTRVLVGLVVGVPVGI